MILISHRGNLNGKTPERENSPSYIEEAIAAGYAVEIDVWYVDNKWYLGHDANDWLIDQEFLVSHCGDLWLHAKNIEAAWQLARLWNMNFFYHQTDDITLTSGCYLWTFPGKRPLTDRSIAVLPENTDWSMDELNKSAGICSDFIAKYRSEISVNNRKK